jgi:hypothetical protein
VFGKAIDVLQQLRSWREDGYFASPLQSLSRGLSGISFSPLVQRSLGVDAASIRPCYAKGTTIEVRALSDQQTILPGGIALCWSEPIVMLQRAMPKEMHRP